MRVGETCTKVEEERRPGNGRLLVHDSELALEFLMLALEFLSLALGDLSLEPEGLCLALCLESTSVRPLDLLGQFSLEQFFNASAARFLNEANVGKGVGKGSFLVVRDLGRVDRHDCCGRG